MVRLDLAAYGVVNTAAFGGADPAPARPVSPAQLPSLADSAETFEDIAGQGRKHVSLGLAMAVACFSLIGIPLTIGFLGKLMLIKPALHAHFYWLVGLTMLNAAISCAYYLRIVAALFLRPEPIEEAGGLAVGAAGERLPRPQRRLRLRQPVPHPLPHPGGDHALRRGRLGSSAPSSPPPTSSIRR